MSQKGQVVERIGAKLRSARQERKLSLREVEERSVIFARAKGDDSYRISASWLHRLEREEHELTVNKLLVLAHIYGFAAEHLFRILYPILLAPAPEPDETTLLLSCGDKPSGFYKWGVIGKHDHTLGPLIPVGSYVKIDTRIRVIAAIRSWANEFQRPIYFLLTKGTYLCGWCELDSTGNSLTVVPHPLSPAHTLYWKDREDVEIIGRVVATAISLQIDEDLRAVNGCRLVVSRVADVP